MTEEQARDQIVEILNQLSAEKKAQITELRVRWQDRSTFSSPCFVVQDIEINYLTRVA